MYKGSEHWIPQFSYYRPLKWIRLWCTISRAQLQIIFTDTTVNVSNMNEASYFVIYPITSGSLPHTIYDITGELTLSIYHGKTDFDTTVQVFQDSIECSFLTGNDDYCGTNIDLKFNALDTENT